jgi:hypothetical protein
MVHYLYHLDYDVSKGSNGEEVDQILLHIKVSVATQINGAVELIFSGLFHRRQVQHRAFKGVVPCQICRHNAERLVVRQIPRSC